MNGMKWIGMSDVKSITNQQKDLKFLKETMNNFIFIFKVYMNEYCFVMGLETIGNRIYICSIYWIVR